MPLTVLFDLDETLLNTNMGKFLPGYFELLSRVLSHHGSHDHIIQQINHAVGKMVANQDPAKTLKEVFAENFYAQLGTTEIACQPLLEIFYRQQYPTLKPVTQTKPEASELVEWCQSEGMMMVIATNPLFPQTATRQRIEWAGLDPEEFVLFTSYDDFHFTKPQLAYYAEVLGRLGWPEHPTVMIGDNLTDDLMPMDTIGADTFWINHEQGNPAWESGTLSDVKPWLKIITRKNELNSSAHIEVDAAILLSTPAVIDTWLRAAPTKPGRKNRQPKDNRIMDLLASLISLEEVIYLPIWENIVADEFHEWVMPEEIAMNPKDWGNQQHPRESFDRFLKARKLSLNQIETFYKNKQHDLDEKLKPSVDKFVRWMAENDRIQLRHCMNL